MEYGQAVHDGRVTDASLFFFHRQSSDEHDLTTIEGARAAVIEASGPAAEWRDIDAIVSLWNDPTTDRQYWERVWCNRLVKGSRQAFDVLKWDRLSAAAPNVGDELITLGFDGSQTADATGLVATHVRTGYQWKLGLWEKPLGGLPTWRVPALEVDAAVRDAFARYNVWRMYADPPYWQEWVAKWQGLFGEERVIPWWTNRTRQMASALEAFDTAIDEGTMQHDGDPDLRRHIGNARRRDLPQRNEQNLPLWVIQKDRSDSPNKIDLAMAAILGWEARTDAIASGVLNEETELVAIWA